MPLVYKVKEFIGIRLRILGLAVLNTYQTETAHFGANWGSILSGVFYTITYVIFVHVLFSNVRTLAGYSLDQALFLMLVGQAAFYSLFYWSDDNIHLLMQNVNRGNLDIALLRPMPTLFYLLTREISVIGMLKEALLPCVFLIAVIHWHTLSFQSLNIVLGLSVLVAGIICFHVIQFLLAMPVFWKGEAKDFYGLNYSLYNNTIPFEGFSHFFKITFTAVLPFLIAPVLAVSVMLGKTSALKMTLISWGVAIIFLLIRRAVWLLALRNYSSASS